MPLQIRVYYDDTDAGGVVYYANYLKYLERARTDFMEQLGFSVKGYQDEGIWFTVVRIEVNYRSPAFYGDVVDVSTQLVEAKRVRFTLTHTIRNSKGVLLVEATTTMACVDSTMKPRALPEELSAAFAQVA